MSWESSLEYYRIINESVRDRLGRLHSAKIVMYSFDFEEIELLQRRGEWEKLTGIMVNAAQKVEKAGAGFVAICTNTMHKMAGKIEKNINIPLLHIADATAEAIKGKGLNNVGLLGTRSTMEHEFYKDRLFEKHGISAIIPGEKDRGIVHAIIYDELCRGKLCQNSKKNLKKIMERLVASGAQGIVLGCTEIPLLIQQKDVAITLFNTTEIHAKSIVDYSLRKENLNRIKAKRI